MICVVCHIRNGIGYDTTSCDMYIIIQGGNKCHKPDLLGFSLCLNKRTGSGFSEQITHEQTVSFLLSERFWGASKVMREFPCSECVVEFPCSKCVVSCYVMLCYVMLSYRIGSGAQRPESLPEMPAVNPHTPHPQTKNL